MSKFTDNYAGSSEDEVQVYNKQESKIMEAVFDPEASQNFRPLG